MTCIRIESGFICTHRWYRLRLLDGRYIFMEWHPYLGPTVYRDRSREREITEWWKDNMIIKALDWFQGRGNKG